MKWTSMIARVLLGAIFLYAGATGMLSTSAPSSGADLVHQYTTVMRATPYGFVLSAVQALCGMLLIADLFAPFALIVIAANLFNIFMIHIFLEPGTYGLAMAVTAVWVIACANYRGVLRSLLRPRQTLQLAGR